MLAEQKHFKSTGEFKEAVVEAKKNGIKRNYLEDAQEFLRLEDVKWQFEHTQSEIPQIPTIFAVHHYVRGPLRRILEGLSTTNDSIRTSSLTTVGGSEISNREMTWTIKGKLGKLLGIFSGLREAQEATVFVYDFIDVDAPGREIHKAMTEAVDKGKNLGLYPTGKPGRKLMKPRRGIPGFRKPEELVGFRAAIRMYYQAGKPFQVMPVSIFEETDMYRVVFGNAISCKEGLTLPERKEDIIRMEQETMAEIARNLPPSLRGDYKDLV